MYKVEIDRTALNVLRRDLKQIDPALARQLGKDLKAELNPFAATIQGKMPSSSPLLNLVRGERVWSPSKVKIAARPGAGWGKPFAMVTAEGSPNKAMAKIVEFAGKGKKNYVQGPRGEALIRNLNKRFPTEGREGRFFFQAYKSSKRDMQAGIRRVLDRFAEEASRRLMNG